MSRLYEGAIVEISDNVTLEFSSENAQTSDLKMKENPNVEECAFSLETEDKIVAGKRTLSREFMMFRFRSGMDGVFYT